MSTGPRHKYGFVEWFRPGEYQRTEEVLNGLVASGASHLRMQLSWAEFHAEGGQEWYDWLIPQLGSKIDLLPCVLYTPPSLSRTGKSSGAPRSLKDYADFIDFVLTRYGDHFEHIELWNEPNNLLDWDWREDQEFELFSEMVGGAAFWARQRGWKPVLGGPCPFDAYWLDLMGQRGVLAQMSAVGVHGFPGTWDSEAGSWAGWENVIAEAREIVSRYNDTAEIWITETGYSTWRRDEIEQVRRFTEAVDTSADRMYWYSWRDVPQDVAVQEGLWFDPRHYHLGAVDHNNRPKLLGRLLKDGGLERIREVSHLAAPVQIGKARPAVVTGGSGFIGCNVADSLLRDGHDVIIIDNLSRPGVEQNLSWLKRNHQDRVHAVMADVRDYASIAPAIAEGSEVYHFAAQTAVTTSLDHPAEDFEINARGTLNVLEAVRAAGASAPVIFSSTNKVYGALDDLEMIAHDKRYIPADNEIRSKGISEARKLDFCTPYGCSKGVADQYVLDYAKSYGLKSVVLRMSCIYGPRQFGTEDQGWVAHFLLKALRGEPISIYGDGLQVRDILHVNDAVRAYRGAMASIDKTKGRAFNLGGGPHNAVSVRIVLDEIARVTGRRLDLSYADWRNGDQLYFVSDNNGLGAAIDWRPSVSWREGIKELAAWLKQHRLPALSSSEQLQRETA